MSIEQISEWHQRARPDPTQKNLDVQAGCHFEEVSEMIEAMDRSDPVVMQAFLAVKALADALKGNTPTHCIVLDRKLFLDAMADQVVTGVGTAHCARMNIIDACERVNASNWSKYDDNGQPIFNENGKITKGPNYVEPDLSGLY